MADHPAPEPSAFPRPVPALRGTLPALLTSLTPAHLRARISLRERASSGHRSSLSLTRPGARVLHPPGSRKLQMVPSPRNWRQRSTDAAWPVPRPLTFNSLCFDLLPSHPALSRPGPAGRRHSANETDLRAESRQSPPHRSRHRPQAASDPSQYPRVRYGLSGSRLSATGAHEHENKIHGNALTIDTFNARKGMLCSISEHDAPRS